MNTDIEDLDTLSTPNDRGRIADSPTQDGRHYGASLNVTRLVAFHNLFLICAGLNSSSPSGN